MPQPHNRWRASAVMSLTSKHATLGQGAPMGLSNSFMSLGRIARPLWAGFAFERRKSAGE